MSTPWERRLALVAAEDEARRAALEAASGLPCVGDPPAGRIHTALTVDVFNGVRVCWACDAAGYDLMRPTENAGRAGAIARTRRGR